MTYTAGQAMAVALYNAGGRAPGKGLQQLADELVAGLQSMGWRLDGTQHEVDLATSKAYLDEDEPA